LILDVGCGEGSLPEADVYVDIRKVKVKEDSSFVLADGCHLPFRNKVFELVSCRMVIEHVDDPAQLCRELERVGNAGFISTVTPLWETLFGRPYHKWVGWTDSEGLVLQRENSALMKRGWFGSNFGEYFDKLFAKDDEFKLLFALNRFLFDVEYYWQTRIHLKLL